ncbi:MAG: TonB-dependent receptor [Vicinamibacterales bacterium]
MSTRFRILVAVVSLVAAGQAAASAQDNFRQTVVVTAAATPVELGSVSRTLTVITHEQIAELPARSVVDLLRLVASVDVRARGDRGMQADLSVRGASFGQALVLVDGVRLNDAQSGHHNGDIPVPLDAIERIEVLHGAGSSLFGADAFGGTINIITRREAPASVSLEAGSFDLLAARGQASFARGDVRQLVSASADHSTGFMYERQFQSVDLLARTSVGTRSSFTVSYLWKDFGANGFYGAAPSHEWTNQSRLAADHRFGSWAGWDMTGLASYRTHGDHFLFNVERPGVSENFHRSHAILGSLKATRTVGGRASLTAGVDTGTDWIRSTNLRNHSTTRVSGFAEWRQPFGARVQADASLRVDRYDEFGSSASPAAGISWWLTPAFRLKASGGRAFRVPTFTERYYSDPANLARAEVGPESSWAGEGGVDLVLANDWMLQANVFGRRDRDVIDWLRATPADRWRTFNVHTVRTIGLELNARRTLPSGAFVQAGYTGIDLAADTVSTLCGASACLSKYVLEYAPHALTAAAMVPLPGAVRLAPSVQYKHRRRNAVIADDVVMDLRVSRRFGRYDVRVEATNLGDTTYQEITGVAMPGRAATISLVYGGR